MFPYWLLFAFFAAGSLIRQEQGSPEYRQARPILVAGLMLAALMIGLRNEVGGDWDSYRLIFAYTGFGDLERAVSIGDPGYQFLNWFVQQLDIDIWLVNLVSGSVFIWGLSRLARTQPDPWLAVLVAVPYLIIVVAMGYTRQAVAIGVLMAGLASFQRGGSAIRFAVYVAVAALFHRTAVVALPIVLFAGERNRLINVIGAVGIFLLIFEMLLADSVDQFLRNYIEARYSSEGAAIRVVMNLIPALIFLARPRLLSLSDQDRLLWRYFSYAAIGCAALLLVSPSSTAVDRIALYITPLQMVVLGRLGALSRLQPVGRLMVIFYSFSVLFVWLNFAVHADAWVPYEIYPLL